MDNFYYFENQSDLEKNTGLEYSNSSVLFNFESTLKLDAPAS